jgi:hypothetical protein
MFVTLKSGERYFFIADLSWSAKAIEIPAERIPLPENSLTTTPKQCAEN